MSRIKIIDNGVYDLDTGRFTVMRGGFGGGGRSGPVFFEGQQDLAGSLFSDVLPRFLLEGAPLPGAGAAQARGMQGVGREFASRGLSGSGLEARALGETAVRGAQAQQGAYMDMLDRALTSPGSTSSSGKGGLFCWVAEELYGKDALKTWKARAYVLFHDTWFTRLYKEHGQQWAEWIRDYPVLGTVVKPIWNYMAKIGDGISCRKHS